MPARLLGQLDGRQVIDLCAAPGGKTAQLIAAGANVTAIDSNRKRLNRLRRIKAAEYASQTGFV